MNPTGRLNESRRASRHNGAPRARDSRSDSVFHDAANLILDIEKLIVDVERLADQIAEAADTEIARLGNLAPAALISMLAGGCAAVWFATRRSRSRREESAALTRWEDEGGAPGRLPSG